MVEKQLGLFAGPRQRGKVVAKGPSEFQIQCMVADYLKNGIAPGWMCNHFPAGELRTEATGARLKRAGLKPGWADLILIDGKGRHYWLELKAGKGRLSEDQATFALEMVKRNVPYVVARSVDDAIEVLRDWGAIRTGFDVERNDHQATSRL